jgi:hypothetical protein
MARSHGARESRLGSRLSNVVTTYAAAGLAAAIVACCATSAASAAPTVVFSDGFESGDFSAWSPPQLGGDGTATVQSAVVSTGSFAARLSESGTSGSKAYVRKTFAAAQLDLTVSGDFQVVAQGASSGNVPFFRLFDPSGSRLLSVYRQNGTTGTIGLTYGGAYYTTSAKIALGVWGTIAVHVVTNGASSTVAVSLNGATVYATTTASLGSAGVSTLQIGNDTAAQAFTILADTISAQSGASTTASPPANTALPTISGTAQAGQTLTASSGSWSGSQPIAYGYQWQRCDTAGANCSPIGGATATSYTATSSDVGATLAVTVTATNSAGSSSATSPPTTTVQAATTTPPPPPPGLVALWHMDETTGTVMHDSVGSHNGSLVSVGLGLPGFTGSDYSFNGSSSYVSVPSAADLNPGTANITMTIHLKTTGTPPPPPADWDLFRKGLYTTAGGEYKMEFQQSGQASCGFEGSAGYSELIAGPALNDGKWHTIQCVKTATAIELIVDGQTFTQAANVGSISNTAAVVIGARPGSDWYGGELDEASIQIG